MPNTLIQHTDSPQENQQGLNKDNSLFISEMFSDTIQGEGIYTGHPATFIRLKDCTLSCGFCDSYSVWRYGARYSFEYVMNLMKEVGLVDRLEMGQHLVLTGGSPLLQQHSIKLFVRAFIDRFEFKPFIEIENECVIEHDAIFSAIIDCWNNSPKLENSNMAEELRYNPDALKQMSKNNNAWFKFVVTKEGDWAEIEKDFLDTGLIKKRQVILMPEGECRGELNQSRRAVVDICCRECVRYSDRQHIVIWDKTVGV